VSLLYTLQVFTCFLFCPLWGVAASYFSIRRLLAAALFAGALLNILTSIVYITNSYAFFVVLQLLKGLCLAPCQTLNRALIPKYYRLADRGKYYGMLEVSAGIGGLAGVIMGSTSYIGGTGGCYGGAGPDGCDGGFPKWSVPFMVLGTAMIPCGFGVLFFVVDPSKDQAIRHKLGEDRLKIAFPGLLDEDTALTWKLVRHMFSVKTWIYTVLQGVTGAFPWPALALLLYWFQLLGIDPFLSILVSAGPAIGAAAGGGIGGLIGDRLYRRCSKKYGRVSVSQTSVASGPFLMIILFFVLPQSSRFWWLFAIYGILAGLAISWSAPNNNANLSDVFPEATFPLAYGVSQLCEGKPEVEPIAHASFVWHPRYRLSPATCHTRCSTRAFTVSAIPFRWPTASRCCVKVSLNRSGAVCTFDVGLMFPPHVISKHSKGVTSSPDLF
jgi:MFS family permease